MTMAEQKNTFDSEKAQETLERRAETGKGLLDVAKGARVVGVVSPSSEQWLGKTVTVIQVDSSDPRLTLFVREPGTERCDWIHEVEPVAVVEKADEVSEEHVQDAHGIAVGALQDEITTLKSAKAALEQSLQEQVNRVGSLRSEHEQFKAQVREVAIRVAQENGWCDNGLNEVLDELGLDRKTTEYEVEVKVIAYAYKTVTVQAESTDDASEKAEDLFRDGEEDLSDLDWEIDEVETREVNEA